MERFTYFLFFILITNVLEYSLETVCITPKTIPLLHIKIFVVLCNILLESFVPLSMKTYKRFTLTSRELHKDMNS